MINFIGIGAQKCASSWIYEVLKNSNQTCLSEKKELDFFSHFFDKGYEWYESNFQANNEKIIGEVSPSYFYNSDVPRRAFEYNPNMKIVLSLRDPVKRMYSNHLHEVRAGNISGENLNFETALKNNPLYLEQSCYSIHIKKWLTYFKLENIHIVFQEEVSLAPQTVSDNLCQFLGLDKLPLIETTKINESLKNKNKFVGRFFNIGGNLFRKIGLKETLHKLKNSKVLGSIYSKNKIHISETIEPMSPQAKAHLAKLFIPYNQELKTILSIEKLPWETT